MSARYNRIVEIAKDNGSHAFDQNEDCIQNLWDMLTEEFKDITADEITVAEDIYYKYAKKA